MAACHSELVVDGWWRLAGLIADDVALIGGRLAERVLTSGLPVMGCRSSSAQECVWHRRCAIFVALGEQHRE